MAEMDSSKKKNPINPFRKLHMSVTVSSVMGIAMFITWCFGLSLGQAVPEERKRGDQNLQSL